MRLLICQETTHALTHCSVKLVALESLIEGGFCVCSQLRSFLRDSTDAKIAIRVGIHSGQVECGVIGLARWRFDVWSAETCVAEQMVLTGVQGFVNIYCKINNPK